MKVKNIWSLIIVFENRFKKKKQKKENIFDYYKIVLCFMFLKTKNMVFLKTKNMVFLNNIF